METLIVMLLALWTVVGLAVFMVLFPEGIAKLNLYKATALSLICGPLATFICLGWCAVNFLSHNASVQKFKAWMLE